MVKLVLVLVLFLLSLSVLTSCSSSRQFDVEVIEDYRKGSSGLQLDFIRGSPPSDLLPDSSFAIGLDIHNAGASSIGDGIVVLNYPSDYVELETQNLQHISLAGKNQLNPDGEERSYFFNARSLYLDLESSSRSLPLSVSACYRYETILTETICVGMNHDNDFDSGDPVCDVRDYTYSGQGSPLVIESVNLALVPTDADGIVIPVFDIVVSHHGSGIITNPDNYAMFCTNSLRSSGESGVFRIKDASLSDMPLSCKGSEQSLTDGKKRIKCESLRGVNKYMMPFQAPFNLVLEFGYTEFESLTIDLVE